MTTQIVRTQTRRRTGAMIAMYTGLLLTAAVTVAPYVDRGPGDVLADHIRHGYPTYSPGQVAAAESLWLAILTVIGVLGIAGWAVCLWAVRVGKSWSRVAATALLVVCVAVALCALLTTDTSGEVGLAPLFGWLGLLPCVAGAVAVALLWRAPTLPATGGERSGASRL